MRTHLHLGVLAEEIRKHTEAFDHHVARAHWEAEEIRAGGGPIDEDLALAGYDPNPFNWTGGMRQDASFLWIYPAHEAIRKQVVQTRLKDLLATQSRQVTFPYYRRPRAVQGASRE